MVGRGEGEGEGEEEGGEDVEGEGEGVCCVCVFLSGVVLAEVSMCSEVLLSSEDEVSVLAVCVLL